MQNHNTKKLLYPIASPTEMATVNKLIQFPNVVKLSHPVLRFTTDPTELIIREIRNQIIT